MCVDGRRDGGDTVHRRGGMAAGGEARHGGRVVESGAEAGGKGEGRAGPGGRFLIPFLVSFAF